MRISEKSMLEVKSDRVKKQCSLGISKTPLTSKLSTQKGIFSIISLFNLQLRASYIELSTSQFIHKRGSAQIKSVFSENFVGIISHQIATKSTTFSP